MTRRSSSSDKRAGEAAGEDAAVEVLVDDLSDHGAQRAIFPLEAFLVEDRELIEMLLDRPVKSGPLRVTRTIHSRRFANDRCKRAEKEHGRRDVAADRARARQKSGTLPDRRGEAPGRICPKEERRCS